MQYRRHHRNPNSQRQEIHTSVSLTAGQTYAFVIGGGVGGNATGGYRLENEGAPRSSCGRRGQGRGG